MSDQIGVPVKRMVKRRPAKKQKTVEKKALEQTGQTYNVWYGKWAGGDKYDEYNAKEKSQSRVCIETDVGYTRADGGNTAFCCLFFARGCCPLGSDCAWLHRLPPPASSLPDSAMDVFGREKHSEYRDDMGGVGTFNRINRTLYIGKIKEGRNTAETLERHFEEFGEIERIRVLQGRGVAFVTFVSELHAQFAKEAMMNQSLDESEVINVRWATEDPNQTAKDMEQAHLVNMGEAGIAKGLDPEFVQAIREMDELEGIVEKRAIDLPEQDQEEPSSNKKARIEPSTSTETTSAIPLGLLSARALDSLKIMASLNKVVKVAAPKSAAVKAPTGLSALADYGSDDE